VEVSYQKQNRKEEKVSYGNEETGYIAKKCGHDLSEFENFAAMHGKNKKIIKADLAISRIYP